LVAGSPSIASMHTEARSPHKTYQDHQTHHIVGSDCKKISKEHTYQAATLLQHDPIINKFQFVTFHPHLFFFELQNLQQKYQMNFLEHTIMMSNNRIDFWGQ
jgi:hypothetical protein